MGKGRRRPLGLIAMTLGHVARAPRVPVQHRASVGTPTAHRLGPRPVQADQMPQTLLRQRATRATGAIAHPSGTSLPARCPLLAEVHLITEQKRESEGKEA